MKCLLLCAGYARRLWPLTKDKPKPLLPIGGVPLLDRILERVNAVKEIDRIYIVSNHRFVSHFYYWLKDRGDDGRIEIFDDNTTSNDDRLGAIGDIHFVLRAAKVEDDLIVIAGDNLLMFELSDFVTFAKPKGLAIAVKDVKTRDLAKLYGVVTLDKDAKVVDFEEKPARPTSTLISIGMYYFSKEKLGLISRYVDEGHNKDAPGYLIQWLHQVAPLYAYTIQGQWYDIGDIQSYNHANALFGA